MFQQYQTYAYENARTYTHTYVHAYENKNKYGRACARAYARTFIRMRTSHVRTHDTHIRTYTNHVRTLAYAFGTSPLSQFFCSPKTEDVNIIPMVNEFCRIETGTGTEVGVRKRICWDKYGYGLF